MTSQLHRTILIVEDSPEDREMYRRYLMHDQDYDYQIVEASLGEEGLNLWQQHKPDAVLLDYRLPDLDGIEFLSTLETHQPLPIVMMTGVGSEKIAVQAIKAGAQDYLIKGQITPEGLKRALDTTIRTVQLKTQLQERIDRERIVARIAQKVLRTLDIKEIFDTTVSEVRQFLQTDRMIVFQVEPDGNGRVVAESVGEGWQAILCEQIYDPCFANSYVERQRQGRVTVKADIYDGSIDPCHVQLLARYQVKANLVVPILHDSQLWGVLIAHHCAAPRQWQSLEIDLLQQLSEQISIAIRQAELYKQAQDELAERKRTEEILRSSEERLLLGLQAAQMGTWDWDIANDFTYFSPEMANILEIDGNDLVNGIESWKNLIHPEDKERVLEQLQAKLENSNNFYNLEYRIRAKLPEQWKWIATHLKVVVRDSEGQAQRIVGIHRDIDANKRTEIEVQNSLNEKKNLLKEIHHRVKNNLQVICSLINLQSRVFKSKALKTQFEETQNRIKSMALVHEKLYQSESLSKINMAEHVQDLIADLRCSFGQRASNIDMNIEIASNCLIEMDIAVPFGLIINELISNAFKHAFSPEDKGSIWVQAGVESEETIFLKIKDNGVGLPQDFDFESSKTLGLILVKDLVEQLEGTIKYINSEGLSFFITLCFSK
jgi:PAS domain S-box-containing protein